MEQSDWSIASRHGRNQDICNMKMKFSNSSEECIIVLLNKFVQMDASNVGCVVLDDDEKKYLNHISSE